MRRAAAVMVCILAGCSETHVFEVDVGGENATGAELTLYEVTTTMERKGATFIGRRENRADGSGQITVTYANGRQVVCPIGYVANSETEPHRFIITNGRCKEEAA